MKTRKNPSLSYIKNGDPQAPRKGTHRPLGADDSIAEIIHLADAGVFVKTPGALVVDPRVSVYDKALFDSIELIIFLLGECRKPLAVVAAIANVSARHAKRSVKNLIACGYVARKRAARRGFPDLLVTITKASARAAKSYEKCSTCMRERPLQNNGICGACNQQATASIFAERTLAQRGMMDWEVFRAIAHANMYLKASKKQLYTAYRLAVERRESA